MSTQSKPNRLEYDISIRFTCGTFSQEKVVLRCCSLPKSTEGMFFNDESLLRSAPFEILLICGGRILGSKTDELPIDWQNPFNIASAGYDKIDKGLLIHIPLIGRSIESVLPDARWRYALWYHITIDESGCCDYKIHIGPPENIDVRNKCEGTCQL